MYFFLIFIGTIVLMRLLLLSRQVHSPTIGGFRLHHYMYGIMLIGLSVIISSTTLFAIGLGLFVDELPQVIRNKWTWDDYYSLNHSICVLFIVVLFFVFRNYILRILGL